MYCYDVWEKQIEEKIDVFFNNGLNIVVDVMVCVNLVYNEIGGLYEKFGKDYVNIFICLEVCFVVWEVIGKFMLEEFYFIKCDEV